jgi:plasmid stabilization system protein ParE
MVTINWTEPAIEDLRAIRDYIARDSRVYAQKLVDEAFDKADILSEWPNRGRRIPEENDPAVRELAHYSYRIIYHILPDHIDILAVIHGRRERWVSAEMEQEE